MYCAKCGTQLPDHVRFCPVCGMRIMNPDAGPAPYVTGGNGSNRQTPYRHAGRSTNTDRGKANGRNTPGPVRGRKEEESRAKPVLFAVLVMVVSALFGVFVFMAASGGLGNPLTPFTKTESAGEQNVPVVQNTSQTAPAAQSNAQAQTVSTAQSTAQTAAQSSAQSANQPEPRSTAQDTAPESTPRATPTPLPTPEPLTGYTGIRDSVASSGNSSGMTLGLVTTDVSDYPNVRAYYSLKNSDGEAVILNSPTAGVTEAVGGGAEIERKIRSIECLDGNEGLGMDIVIDKSDSMESDFPKVQSILREFIQSIDYASGDAAEIIAFDSYIMYMCSYTNEMSNLLNGISNMSTYGMTALYDALWTGVTNAGRRTGANCVIGFTDGADNESRHTYDEVISLANSLGVPIYLIGTSGAEYSVLQYICEATGGYYWWIDSISDMNEILDTIYRVQKNMYCIEYESDSSADPYSMRTISAAIADNSGQNGGISEHVSFTPARRAEKVTHSERYELIKADVSWTEANDAALIKGGHLATITSQQEMNTLVSMAEKAGIRYVWIGGYTSVRNNAAYGHWLTGEKFDDFTAWYPGEPSRTDTLDNEPEFYIMLWKVENSWSWNDQRNDVLGTGLAYFRGNLGYIIEYEE